MMLSLRGHRKKPVHQWAEKLGHLAILYLESLWKKLLLEEHFEQYMNQILEKIAGPSQVLLRSALQ